MKSRKSKKTKDVSSSSFLSLERRSSEAEQSLVSRIIFQKLLISESSRYLSRESRKLLNEYFLSENPREVDLCLQYRINLSKEEANDPAFSQWQSYDDYVSTLNASWMCVSEVVDDKGNAWNRWVFEMNISIDSSYKMNWESFSKKSDCIAALRSVVQDIQQLEKRELYIFHLTNEQRLAREAAIKHAKTCSELSEALKKDKKHLCARMRRGSKRNFKSKELQSMGVDPGVYIFDVEIIRHPRWGWPPPRAYQICLSENEISYIERIR